MCLELKSGKYAAAARQRMKKNSEFTYTFADQWSRATCFLPSIWAFFFRVYLIYVKSFNLTGYKYYAVALATTQHFNIFVKSAAMQRQSDKKNEVEKKWQCGTEREENRTERKKRQNWKKTELKNDWNMRKKRHAHRILVPND